MKVKKNTYAGIPKKYGSFKHARVCLTPIPYDATSTWGKGADKGYQAFLTASENMELYDIETNSEPYLHGIFLDAPLKVKKLSPEEMVDQVYRYVSLQLKAKKLYTYFGGEHSISIGIIRAFAKKYKNISVLQLDAHTDLRQEYLGTKFNHACALAEAQKTTNLVQVGIRSMDKSEMKYVRTNNVYWAHQIMDNDFWMEEAIQKLSNKVYITLDLDVLDSSLMPSTGTPEPGGMQWYQLLQFLRMVFNRKEVLGFDIVELAPNPHNRAPDFLAAKLYYKMLAYYFEKENKRI